MEFRSRQSRSTHEVSLSVWEERSQSVCNDLPLLADGMSSVALTRISLQTLFDDPLLPICGIGVHCNYNELTPISIITSCNFVIFSIQYRYHLASVGRTSQVFAGRSTTAAHSIWAQSVTILWHHFCGHFWSIPLFPIFCLNKIRIYFCRIQWNSNFAADFGLHCVGFSLFRLSLDTKRM